LNNTPYKSRTLTVEQSVAKGKRATINVTRNTASPSPSADETYTHPRARTIALMNVPDTVSAARIEKLCAESGTLRKVVLRPDHGGVIVEFAEEQSVGRASLALDGKELDGRNMIVGTVDELFKRSGPGHNKAREKKKSSFAGGMVPRAAQNAGARRGGRGGLGQRKGLGFASRQSTTAAVDGEAPAAGGKSNDDFRALLLKGKEPVQLNETEKDAGD
jgi:hypothetical protein